MGAGISAAAKGASNVAMKAASRMAVKRQPLKKKTNSECFSCFRKIGGESFRGFLLLAVQATVTNRR